MLYLILLALFTVLLTSKPASALTPDWVTRPDLKPYEKAEAIGGYDEATMLRIARWLKAEEDQRWSPRLAGAKAR